MSEVVKWGKEKRLQTQVLLCQTCSAQLKIFCFCDFSRSGCQNSVVKQANFVLTKLLVSLSGCGCC